MKYKPTKNHKRKIGLANSIILKGRHLIEEHKKNISNTLKRKGIKPPNNKGGKAPWVTNQYQKGKRSKNWKGGRLKTPQGYIRIYKPQWSSSDTKGYVCEHRYLIEKRLGRILKKWEYIHHKNGIKDDNRPENLEIVFMKKHYGKVQCPYCEKEFLIK